MNRLTQHLIICVTLWSANRNLALGSDVIINLVEVLQAMLNQFFEIEEK